MPPGRPVSSDWGFWSDARVVPGQYLVVFRDSAHAAEPLGPKLQGEASGALSRSLPRLLMQTVSLRGIDDATAMQLLNEQAGVTAVLHDRLVLAGPPPYASKTERVPASPAAGQLPAQPAISSAPAGDGDYLSPQGWAVRQVGGYGGGIGTSQHGPWDQTMGAGVRLALLDSGVDALHPDIAPNLALNLSEIDPAALPSACDDASPLDQQGHGTWTASLAAGAAGPQTGAMVGAAPQAVLLNIKVLERLPAATATTLQAQCEAGEPGGLLSWVLAGIDDAIAQKADVIALPLGVLVDLSTGDGAGWRTAFDQATHAATGSGAVVIAALGNDGLDLSPNSSARYMELPAQARDVLAVVASTNAACVEDDTDGATCSAGAIARASYSNFGATGAVAAPGGALPNLGSTGVTGFIRGACSQGRAGTADGLPASGASFGCFSLGHAAYVNQIGTSASAALTAGVAALVRAAHPNWTPAQVVTALRSGAGSAGATSSMQEPQVNAATALAARP